ncbi:hypothetical protein PhCBS80983_g05796 [Powellomyces hirtus]|uniref:TmcB/TmcC TPR repeats domain-containing protein n=1 Tax=Powellomyces hirtus TaxID=109895 RepID=A0A507DSN0_9FUNG|nr:hypothetical protein PhCBS80983_g05796 [Powellomyces hirtus]
MTAFSDEDNGPRGVRPKLIREHPFVAATFGLLHAMTHGNHIPVTLAIAICVIEDIQLFSFAMQPSMGYAKMPSWFPLIFNPMSAKPHSDSAFAVLFYIAFVVTSFTAGLTLVVGLSMKGPQIRVVWPLQILRVMTTLLSTVLFIPLMEIFLHALSCYDTETERSLLAHSPSECLNKKYLPQFILSIFSLIYLALQGLAMSLVFFKIDPIGKDPHARTTGRIDAIYSCLRILLCVSLTVLENTPAAVITVIIISSAIMLYLTCRYQPYFKGMINDLRGGMCFGSLICGITSAVVYGSTPTNSVVPLAVVCALVLPGFAIGVMLSRAFRKVITARVYARLKAVIKVEEHEVIAGKSSSNIRRSKHDRSGSVLKSKVVFDTEKLDLESSNVNDIDSVVKKHDVKPTKVFVSTYDVELSVRFLQHNCDMEARRLAAQLLQRGVEQFPNASNAHLMRAHYTAYYELGPPGEVWECLVSAKKSKPLVDTRFFIFMEEMSLDQEKRREDLVASSMGIAKFAEVNALEEEAERYHLETLIAIKRLWQFLRTDKDSAPCLPYLLEKMEEKRSKAMSRYEDLIRKFPNSQRILRAYISFLLRATDDLDTSKKIHSELEKEEARSVALAAASAPTSDVSQISAPSECRLSWESTNDEEDDIKVGEDAAAANRRSQVERPLGIRPSSIRRKSVTLALGSDLPIKPDYEFPEEGKRGPRSVSSQGSQKDRYMRYLRDAIGKGLKAPIDHFNIIASIALFMILVLVIGGFVFCLTVYNKITTELPVAYDRARLRVTSLRFGIFARRLKTLSQGRLPVQQPQVVFNATLANAIYQLEKTWTPIAIDILMRERTGDPLNIIIRNHYDGYDKLQAYSTFTLGRLITDHAKTFTDLTLSNAYQSRSIQWFVDNLYPISSAYESIAAEATTKFVDNISGSMNCMIAIMVILGAVLFLFTFLLFRPMIRRVHAKQVSISSLFSGMTREHISQIVEGYDAEIETMMESMDNTDVFAEIAASNEAGLPPTHHMLNHGPKRQFKFVTLFFCFVAIPGILMFAPTLKQGVYANSVVLTTRGIADRNLRVALVTATALELAANEPSDVTPPQSYRAWLEYHNEKFVAQENELLTSNGGYPSLFDFPNLVDYLSTGRCFARIGCDPAKRYFNESVGLTPKLVTLPYEEIMAKWEQSVASFISLPPEEQTLYDRNLDIIYELVEDLSSGAKKLTDIIVGDVANRNGQSKAFTVSAFVVSAVAFGLGYLLVHQRLVKSFESQIEGCLWMCFTLPPDAVNALPDLKRFIDSAGAILPRGSGV